MPTVLELDAQHVVVAMLQQPGEDLGPRNDAASDDARPDSPLGSVDPGRFRGAEGRVWIREDEVLHVDVTDQVTLNSEGLFILFIVRECQVRLIVKNADGRVVYLPDQGRGIRRGLGHGAEVVFHAEANPGLVCNRRESFQRFTQFCPMRWMVVVPVVPGSGVDTDPVSAEQVRCLYGAAEFIDGCAPFGLIP